MCIPGLFGGGSAAPAERKPRPPTPAPPPPPPVEPIKPAPAPEVLKKEPAAIAPATKKRQGLGIGKTEAPAVPGIPLGIGSNTGSQTINTGG